MNMTPRLKQLLSIMLREGKSVSVTQLSQEIKVSKRTVQRELEALPRALRNYNLQFVSKTGVGVWLAGEEADKAALLALLQSEDAPDVSEREYRRKRLVLELLKEREVRKLYWYSSKFKVSEATISTDLEVAEQWLAAYRLTLVRKLGSGILLEGQEEDYRKAIRAFMAENLDEPALLEAYHLGGKEAQIYDVFRKSGMEQLLSFDLLKRAMQAIDGMQQGQITRLSEQSYYGLVVHVAIAMQRILGGTAIQSEGHWLEKFADDADYATAERIAAELAEEFEVEIPPVETAYICLHMKGAKQARVAAGGDLLQAQTQSADIRDRSLRPLIHQMIYEFDATLAYLLKQDDDFLQGLLAHLQPTVVRLSYDMKIENPMLEAIKREYPIIFEKCKPVGYALEEWLGKPVPEAEIGFLAVHFGAALVRLESQRENRRVVQVGVVCSSGIGISRLLSTKLTQAFRDRIAITAYGTRDITPQVIAKEDFLITSVPLQAEGIRMVQVSPLLSDADMEQVRLELGRHEYTKAKQVAQANARHGFRAVQSLADKIKRVTDQFQLRTLSTNITFDGAIQVVAEHIAQDCVNEQLEITQVLTQREKLATQVYPEFGFALLHAKANAVTEPRFFAFITERAQPFADPYFGGIRIIFVMLIPMQIESEQNAEMLGYISGQLVENDDFVNCVLSGDEAAVQAHLSGLLEAFFSRYLNAR